MEFLLDEAKITFGRSAIYFWAIGIIMVVKIRHCPTVVEATHWLAFIVSNHMSLKTLPMHSKAA